MDYKIQIGVLLLMTIIVLTAYSIVIYRNESKQYDHKTLAEQCESRPYHIYVRDYTGRNVCKEIMH